MLPRRASGLRNVSDPSNGAAPRRCRGTGVAKKKPAPKKPAPKKLAARKPAAKPPARRASLKPRKKTSARASTAAHSPVDPAAALQQLGFFPAEYCWERECLVPALDSRLRLQVDHAHGIVKPEQVRAVELLLESATPLRTAALRAAYECMLRWVEGYRQRHPGFCGKPLAVRTFLRGCDLGTVHFPLPDAAAAKPAPTFILGVFWPDDDRPCEARFEWSKGAWTLRACERN